MIAQTSFAVKPALAKARRLHRRVFINQRHMIPPGPLSPKDGKRDKREIVAWVKHFWHKGAKKRIYAKPGSAFPIYRK